MIDMSSIADIDTATEKAVRAFIEKVASQRVERISAA